MKTDCTDCNGEGGKECEHCNHYKPCIECGGTGKIDCCITEYTISADHKHKDALEEIQSDANKCKADHAKIVVLNPRAKGSYDAQLAATLQKLNQFAESFTD